MVRRKVNKKDFYLIVKASHLKKKGFKPGNSLYYFDHATRAAPSKYRLTTENCYWKGGSKTIYADIDTDIKKIPREKLKEFFFLNGGELLT